MTDRYRHCKVLSCNWVLFVPCFRNCLFGKHTLINISHAIVWLRVRLPGIAICNNAWLLYYGLFCPIRVFSYDCNPSVQLIQSFKLMVFSPVFCAFLFPHHSPPFYLFSFLPILPSVFLCSFSDQSSFIIYSILPFFFLYILRFHRNNSTFRYFTVQQNSLP